jgi:hypothetical protein
MRILKESDIIRLMREEWTKKVRSLVEGVAVKFDDVSDQTKIVHKKSGIRYTVSGKDANEAILRTPEGKEFIVNKSTLEDEYEIG